MPSLAAHAADLEIKNSKSKPLPTANQQGEADAKVNWGGDVDLEKVDFDMCFHAGLLTVAQNTRRLRLQYWIRCTGALKNKRGSSTF